MKRLFFGIIILMTFLTCAENKAKKYHNHPYLSQSQWPIVHHSTFQEAAAPFAGPQLPQGGEFRVDFLPEIQGPAPALFDSKGNILVMGVDAFNKKHIFMKLDYETLEILASYEISISNPLEGLYSFVDNEDCWWNGYYYVISRICFKGNEMFEDMHIDLAKEFPDKFNEDDSIVGIVPLYTTPGMYDLSFVTQGLKPVLENGYFTKKVIGAKAGVLRVNKDKTLNVFVKEFPDENITNNFAVDPEDGIYVLTNGHAWKLRLDNGAGGGELKVLWSVPYESGEPIPKFPCSSPSIDTCALLAIQQSVKFADGSGTTPTLIGDNYEYVAFADGSRPMRIIVLRTSDGSEVPVDNPVPIQDPATQTENTISAYGKEFAIESNYTKGAAGYEIVGEYGSEEVKLKWVNLDVFAPNAVPLISGESNAFYLYEMEGTDPFSSDSKWYVTALDLDTGNILWRQYIGDGLQHNSTYAPLSIDEKGRMYIGLFGGFMRLMAE